MTSCFQLYRRTNSVLNRLRGFPAYVRGEILRHASAEPVPSPSSSADENHDVNEDPIDVNEDNGASVVADGARDVPDNEIIEYVINMHVILIKY